MNKLTMVKLINVLLAIAYKTHDKKLVSQLLQLISNHMPLDLLCLVRSII